ncbi:MAG: preprotein translocase subunit SecA [Phycisphaerales bacterium]|nr:MAG: preprotein translocase subunit SecA [Phycisphaerales bacterium]
MATTLQDKKQAGIPLVGPLLNVLFGSRNERFVKKYTSRVNAINAMEPQMRALTDAQLRAKTAEFRERVVSGAKATDLLDEAFAVAREAMDRAVGIRNVFNPAFEGVFDPSRLPANVRELYEKTKAEMAAREPAPPEGEFRGCTEAQPGWRQVDIPNEVYEAVRELYPMSKPPFRARPFDVQLIGGVVLHQGKIAEMKTGEGKTIVAPLAAYVAAIENRKVHVVTVNDYLVQRDRDWTFPYFHALGLTVGAIHPMHMQPEDQKRVMYGCDVVYGTTAEFGFDYLRDNMKRSVQQQVQKKREFAIVDEVDSILIDEARTPLIISGPAHEDAPRYALADKLAKHLVEKQAPWAEADEKVQRCNMRIKGIEGDIRNAREKDKIPAMQEELKKTRAALPGLEADRDRHTQYYEVELDKRQAHVTHHGIAEAQRVADIGSFYLGENVDMPHLLENAIKAHVVYQLDKDYVIMPTKDPMTGRDEPGIVIVDVFTGRPMVGRQWSDGLHQAVEAKEGVPIKQETQTVATVTIQNFFKMYKRLAGMTGTADTEAQEFRDIYSLDVVSIPTNVQVVRRDFNDMVYLTGKDKWDSIVDEIKAFHDVGRPVLVGTTSVEKSEKLAQMLQKKHGVKHEVLNAKQHEREAHIIENAGQLGAVMIATNMAGRGTDIKLARLKREQLLDHWLRRGLAPRELTVEDTDERVRELVYRKIAPKELGIPKQEAEAMAPDELELRLLRHWAELYTWESPGRIAKMNAEECRESLDSYGRFMLHRIGWVDSAEQLGGLHVIGTERHESRRIDNQLRGRSGRQGDRGSSRFFVSLDDDLMKMFAGETTMKILSRLGMKEGDAIEHPMLSKNIERAQRKVEERNFQIRKQILEYDEVMEHQRQFFYGLRQRVLEGRDIKGLIFGFIQDAVDDSVGTYLDADYPAEKSAEYARQRLEVSVPAERLRGRDSDEMIEKIRSVARDEARSMIDVTLNEYMPDDGDPADHDVNGLALWASKHFGLEIKASEIREMSRDDVKEAMVEAADERIETADLEGVRLYASPEYGAQELCRWAHTTFGLDVKVDEVWGTPELAAGAAGVLRDKVEQAYLQKEATYPVEFVMEMTAGMMSYSPQEAIANLVRWANTRYDMGWDESILRTRLPQQIREDLEREAKRELDEGRLEKEIEAALACETDEALETFCRERLKTPMPESLRGLKGADRENAIASHVELVLRAEMVRFEQFVLLEVLDSTWKDHLYSMDQLRDSIGFRAFSQQDPRIEYKREGSRLFTEMQKTVRDRVTENVFRMRLLPQIGQGAPGSAPGGGGAPQRPPQQAPAAPGRMPAPAAAAAVAGRAVGAPVSMGGGTISGPGLEAPIPGGERHQRDLDAALRAGGPEADQDKKSDDADKGDPRRKSYKKRK